MLGTLDIAAANQGPADRPQTRFAALRSLITSPQLSFLMEAHNGLSAKIAQEAGFAGIWGSGLTLSASMGLRDSNEASWTQVLETLELMADATSLPILLDGDTGYGNFNNVRRLVKKLCDRKVAGVCIEDKLFPKTNSFIGEAQPMAEIDEFCGRIKAGKDSQTDDDFVLVARVEALICGHDMGEALRRAAAYHAAGADAILIHSKQSSAAEILKFAQVWENRAPLVIVPTKYYATPTEQFRQARISTVIWANHLLRGAISAMREVARTLKREESLVEIEHRIAPVDDIFRLVGNDELEEAESRYIPRKSLARGIILAASQGALGALTVAKPKCMVDVRGQPLLQRLVSTLAASGVRNITVVRGYGKETVKLVGVQTVDNDRHAETGELYSLNCAAAAIEGPTVIAYGDILFRKYILDNLLECGADIALAVDVSPLKGEARRDLVIADRPYTGDILDDSPVLLKQAGTDINPGEAHGEWMGLAAFSARGAGWLRDEIARARAEGVLESCDLPRLFTRLAARHPVQILYFTGHWMDVDTLVDLAAARTFSGA
ncbi:MAG: phosphoenolpyruvate mutase [Alphaproteobacteria bacterium]|nr:phosphoenolpyruvate mutase [Alphaproteobacteria bacterium]